MPRIAAISLCALAFLLCAEGIARVVELALHPREQHRDTSRNTFRVAFVGVSACLDQDLPLRMEQRLRRAGVTHAAVLNLCGGAGARQRMTTFLEQGLPLGPQAVVSFDSPQDFSPCTEHLAVRRLILGSNPAPQPALNSYLYATEVIRTLTKSQGGWFAVLLPPSDPHPTPALGEWSRETGAPLFEDRERLFETIVARYRDWTAGLDRESSRSSVCPH